MTSPESRELWSDGTGEARVGKFALRECLGRGGMGAVYRATDTELGRTVAVKVLRSELLGSATARTRFRDEALAASRLDHPGLCPVYEIGEQGDTPYFVMPLFEGHTLADQIQTARSRSEPPRTREQVEAVLELFEGIARALHHAHEHGLVHRDVKPGNVLVRTDGEPVVLDFGLARDPADTAMPTGFTGTNAPGTPLYMAPEQLGAGARAQVDRRVDIYALGVSLYEALTLQPPFSGRSLLELFQAIRSQPTPNPKTVNGSVPRDLQVIVAVATEKLPQRRYPDCAALADDLRRVRTGQPILARPVPLSRRIAHWIKANRAASATLSCLLLGLIVALVLLSDIARTSTDLEASARNAKELNEQAESLRQVADQRLDRFELLDIDDWIRNLHERSAALLPAWPDGIAELATVVAEIDARLPGYQQRVDEALQRLVKLAATTAPRASEEFRLRAEALRNRYESLRRALAVRDGRAPFPTAEETVLPQGGVFDQVSRHILPVTDPDRSPVMFGSERKVLSFLEVLEQLELNPEQDALRKLMVAWAHHALGDHDGAVKILEAAVSSAPESMRSDLAWDLTRMRRANARFPKDLTDAKTTMEAIEAMLALPDATFANPADRVLYEALRRTRFALFDLARPGGVADEIRDASQWAAEIGDLTHNHPGAGATWAEAAAAIRTADGIVASTRYSEAPFDLEPQLGLVPIGANPATGLWEFYHLRSAVEQSDPDAARKVTIPRHGADGTIDVRPETGIIFVLIPGGASTVGAQFTDRSAPFYLGDPRSAAPLARGRVAPYFLARHEITQAQWRRLNSARPLMPDTAATHAYGARSIPVAKFVSLTNPAENVSWREFHNVLDAYGLRLPGSWEWEHGCRAGSTSRFYTGDRAATLEGHANLMGKETLSYPQWRGARTPFDDGHMIHAPVGSYQANAFGLHDMHGNVGEYCQDRSSASSDRRVTRGGSFMHTPNTAARSAGIEVNAMDIRGAQGGARAARSVRGLD